ncbi:MAG: hypothetical protein JW703_04290, partial [Candidatus Diapherotrites archaeon]|nr:hypothetical protein [Candidatus Diapherotrites archaeon]
VLKVLMRLNEIQIQPIEEIIEEQQIIEELTQVDEELLQLVKPQETLSAVDYDYLLKEADEIGTTNSAWGVDFQINGNYAAWKNYDAVNHSGGKIHFYNLKTKTTKIIDVGSDFHFIGLYDDKVMWAKFEQGGTMFYTAWFDNKKLGKTLVNEHAHYAVMFENQLIYFALRKNMNLNNLQNSVSVNSDLSKYPLISNCSLMGDVDGDGVITETDVDLVFEMVMNNGFDECADINEDGVITAGDAQSIYALIQDCSLLGDVDGDNQLTCKDVQCVFDLALGKTPNNCIYSQCANMNGDNSITAGDAQSLQMQICPNGTCNYQTGNCEVHPGTVESEYELVLIDLTDFSEIKRIPAHKDAKYYYVPAFNGKYFTANRVVEENDEVTAVYQDFYNILEGKLIDSIYAGKDRYIPRAAIKGNYAVWLSSKNNKSVLNLFDFSSITTSSQRNKELPLEIGVSSVDGGISIYNDRIIIAGTNNNIVSYKISTGDVYVYHYPTETNFLELKFFGNHFIWRKHIVGHDAYSANPQQKIYLSGFPLEENQTACTKDLKVCSDGSKVSRSPALGCEFKACPVKDISADRLIVASNRHEIQKAEFNQLKQEVQELKQQLPVISSTEQKEQIIASINEKITEAKKLVQAAEINIDNTKTEMALIK